MITSATNHMRSVRAPLAGYGWAEVIKGAQAVVLQPVVVMEWDGYTGQIGALRALGPMLAKEYRARIVN